MSGARRRGHPLSKLGYADGSYDYLIILGGASRLFITYRTLGMKVRTGKMKRERMHVVVDVLVRSIV